MSTDTKQADHTSQADPVQKTSRPWWITVSAAIFIMVCGMIIGAAVTLGIIRKTAITFIRHPEKTREFIAERISDKLDLTDSQSEDLERILKQRHASLMQIRKEVYPRMKAQLDRLDKEVASVLDKDQKTKWKKMTDRIRSNWIPPAPAVNEEAHNKLE